MTELKENGHELDVKLVQEMRNQAKPICEQVLPAVIEHFGDFEVFGTFGGGLQTTTAILMPSRLRVATPREAKKVVHGSHCPPLRSSKGIRGNTRERLEPPRGRTTGGGRDHTTIPHA